MAGMKTLLIVGGTPVPAGLREIVERGSTSFLEQRAADLEGQPALDVDRVVFWSDGTDQAVRSLAETYGRAEAADRRERVVFVSAGAVGSMAAPALPPDELFVWPHDEDRLKMAFLTGG